MCLEKNVEGHETFKPRHYFNDVSLNFPSENNEIKCKDTLREVGFSK